MPSTLPRRIGSRCAAARPALRDAHATSAVRGSYRRAARRGPNAAPASAGAPRSGPGRATTAPSRGRREGTPRASGRSTSQGYS
eukprot:2704590-Prymnesium_polylepis.2